jgi:hypothetical protein
MTSGRPARRSLDPAEVRHVREQFGVADEQVLRDHAVSHVLAALSTTDLVDDLVFIGGTALSRTFLPHLRLSEDIDLITSAPRRDVGRRIESAVAAGLRRTHGSVAWVPALADTRGADSSVLVVGDSIHIRVQLLGATGYPRWPVELRCLEQRYSDAPAASLVVPTAPAFAGWKTATWLDRSAPRDLYDLWGLGRAGWITSEAALLFRTHGPTAGDVRPWMFSHPPTEDEWLAALAHQGRVTVSAAVALDEVADHWARAVSFPND